MTTIPFRTESQEQMAVAKLLRIYQEQGKVILYSKLAQETYTKFITVKRRNRMEGLVEGVPDLLIILKDRVLFIEMKRVKKAHPKTTPAQLAWQEALNGTMGNVFATVAYGYEEAKVFIDKHVIESVKI